LDEPSLGHSSIVSPGKDEKLSRKGRKEKREVSPRNQLRTLAHLAAFA